MKLIRITEDFKDKPLLDQLNEEAFPPEERIPSQVFIATFIETGCDLWALYEEEFVGFTVVLKGEEVAYIWYLAICSDCRSKGYGSKALSILKEKYDQYQLILDMEPLIDDAPNYDERKKRLAFYKKNGFKQTGYGLAYFDTDFEVLCEQDQLKQEAFIALLKRIKTSKETPVLYPLHTDD